MGSGDQSHKYGISLPPTLSAYMLARPENMEGRSPCRENNDSLPIQIPRCDTHFRQFKEKKPMQLCVCVFFFFFWRATEISFVTDILATGELGSHLTITFRDKSRYDLIVSFL